MATPTQRQLRYSELLRRLVAPVLQNDTITGVRSGYLAVHEVHVSADLRHAKVFVVPLDPHLLGSNEEMISRKSTIPEVDLLNAASDRIWSHVIKGLKSKHSPRLTFHLDETFQQASRIESIIRRNHKSTS